jgi:hypothetical protein
MFLMPFTGKGEGQSVDFTAVCQLPGKTMQSSASPSKQSMSLSSDKFLIIAANLLHKALIEVSRADAKRLYRQIHTGDTVALTNLRMEDGSTVRVDLNLGHEQYRGLLGFGSFRAALSLLLANIAEALKTPESLRTFSNEQNADAMIFGVTAPVIEGDQTNVLVLGVDSSGEDATLQLQLIYLDSRQFVHNTDADSVDAPAV